MLRRLPAAVAVIAAGVLPIGVTPAAAAPSTVGTICVALVVDAHSIGGPVSTDCATVKKGATGIDVLEAGGHSVTFRDDGLLCTIDNLPKTGCSAVDDSHYWAYYHRAPGSTTWSYSDEGAGTYQPVNDSTEGWVYDDGTSLKPANIPYFTICKAKATPSPSPTAHATHTASAPVKHTSAPTASPTPTASATRSARPRRHHKRPITTHSPVASLTPSPSTSTAPSNAASSGSSSGGHGTVVGVIVAALIVAALAGGAIVTRRRRQT